MEFYLSEILDHFIVNKNKERMGLLEDIVVDDISKAHPLIKGIVLHRGRAKGKVFIPMHDIDSISPSLIKLSTDIVYSAHLNSASQN